MMLSAKQQARIVFDAVLVEFPVRTWLENMAVDSARSKVEELTEEQCQRIIAKAKLVFNGTETG